MKRYYALIAVCGGITLALEVLASRILTPYFGVSLYIWSGILSTTLIALASGYWFGGWLSQKQQKNADESLRYYFGLMPAVAGLSLIVACLIYPKLFPSLARFNLVLGAVLASSVLLLVPLVAMSSMNSLLIAIGREASGTARRRGEIVHGDAGAGKVFFVSTLGSVLGVWLTAFLLVPTLTNFRSLLTLALLANAIVAVVAYDAALAAGHRRRLLRFLVVSALLAVGLQWGANWYLQKNRVIEANGARWKMIEEVTSYFGNVKVIQRQALPGQEHWAMNDKLMIYSGDGLIQTMTTPDGKSGGIYPFAIEILARGLMPKAENVLVLGMGGGVIPPRFQDCQGDLDVVEVDPHSLRLAEKYFHFQRGKAQIYQMDARQYVNECRKKYDLIVYDTVLGDASAPEHMVTRECMQALQRCLTDEGVVVFNLSNRPRQAAGSSHYCFLKTVNSVFPHLLVYHRNGSERFMNVYLAAAGHELKAIRADLSIGRRRDRSVLTEIFSAPRPIRDSFLRDSSLYTDEHNIFPVVHAREHAGLRRMLIDVVPDPLLVN